MYDLIEKSKSYLTEIKSAKLQRNICYILDQIKRNPNITIYDLRFEFGHIIPHQTLTSRISQLLDCGLIVSNKRVVKDEISYSCYEFVKTKPMRLELMRQRQEKKYLRWCKSGENKFKEYITPELLFQISNSRPISK